MGVSKTTVQTGNFWKYRIKTTQSEVLVRKKLMIGTSDLVHIPITMSVSHLFPRSIRWFRTIFSGNE